MLVGCALLLGLGSGAVDSGLNAYAAGAFGPRHMNWLHAFFGLGVGDRSADHDRGAERAAWPGAGVTASWPAAQILLATAFALTVRAWRRRRTGRAPRRPRLPTPAETPGRRRPSGFRFGATLRLPAVWSGTLAFALYVAIEVSAGLWAFLLLTEGRGLSAAVAGGCVSAYWGSLFVGRVVQGVVAERLGAGLVLRASLAGMAVGAVADRRSRAGRRWRCSAWSWSGSPPRRCSRCSPSPPPTGSARRTRTGPSGSRSARPASARRSSRPGSGVLIGNTSVQVLGSALLVLALALIVLYEWGARRSTAGPPHTAVPAADRRGASADVGAGSGPVVDGR